jgi:hypothetical protein
MKSTMTEEERREAKRAYRRAYQKANLDKYQGYRDKQDKAEKAAYNRAYHQANKERIKEVGKEWRAKNAEKVLADRKRYKDANRNKVREAARRYYWETKETRKEALRANYTKQNRKRPVLNLARNEAALGRKKPDACDACGGNDGGIVFDHCHDRGHARGWLCDRCNCALGFVRDDIPRLRKLIAYLQRTGKHTAPQLVLAGI